MLIQDNEMIPSSSDGVPIIIDDEKPPPSNTADITNKHKDTHHTENEQNIEQVDQFIPSNPLVTATFFLNSNFFEGITSYATFLF